MLHYFQILHTKLKRLEHLLHLKDKRIEDLESQARQVEELPRLQEVYQSH